MGSVPTQFSAIGTLLLTVLACSIASGAGAFGLDMRLNPASADPANLLEPGDDVVVDVYLDAEPGLEFLGLAVIFDDDEILSYDPGSSSMPTYILYNAGSGTFLEPNVVNPGVDPPHYWNGINLPGKRQIIIEYLEPSFRSALASGTNIWITTLTFPVTQIGDGDSTLELTLDAPATIAQAFGEDVKGLTTTTGAFTISTLPPPPCVAEIEAIDLGGETQLDLTVAAEGQGVLGLFMRLPDDRLVTLFSTGFANLDSTTLSRIIPQPALPAGAPGLTYGIGVELADGTICTDKASIAF